MDTPSFNETPIFSLCNYCLSEYQKLCFDKDAVLEQNIMPYATIMWKDEHPLGSPQPLCENETCLHSIGQLINARSEYWEQERITTKYLDVWNKAQELIPSWPGFKRLNLSNKERELIENCIQQAMNWFDALMDMGDGKLEETEVAPGIVEWSTTIDLTDNKDENASIRQSPEISELFPPLRDKTLPIEFTQGWIRAFFDVLWESGGLGVIGIAFRDWFSKVQDTPLYPYYENNTSQFEPIDYWFLEQVRKGIDEYYGEETACSLAEKIGFNWWGYLNNLIGNDVLPPTQFTEHHVHFAVRNFAKNLETRSGISSELEEFDTSLKITFSECPFCANSLPGCNILFGVIQGMLLHYFEIQPLIKVDTKEEMVFGEVSKMTQVVRYQLVGNDSHIICLNFIKE